MNELTAVMITFLRPEYTKECIKSLLERYPGIQLLVAENGDFSQEMKDYVDNFGGRYIQMPYDSGVCYGRNRLVEEVKTPYVLVGDDDFFYTETAMVDRMLKFLQGHDEYSLIGGRVSDKGENLMNYQGIIEIHPDHLHYIPLNADALKFDQSSQLHYQTADIVFNYFVARVADIRDIPWDENIKVSYEHSDWFISLKKAGVPVAYSPDPIVIHKPKHVTPKDLTKYKEFRYRRSDMKYFFEKHKIDYSIGFKGEISRMNTYPEHGRKPAYYVMQRCTFDGKSYNVGDLVYTDHPTPLMRPI